VTLEEIRQLPRDEVVALLAICRKDMRFQDGFWFMNVEDAWGIDRAVTIDADVWSRFGRYEAGLLLKAFEWKEQGIPKLIKALKYAPSWLFFDYSVEQVRGNGSPLPGKEVPGPDREITRRQRHIRVPKRRRGLHEELCECHRCNRGRARVRPARQVFGKTMVQLALSP
jgi:hypothetical protein